MDSWGTTNCDFNTTGWAPTAKDIQKQL